MWHAINKTQANGKEEKETKHYSDYIKLINVSEMIILCYSVF